MRTSLPEAPTADDFRALARSSPWRFRTLHWTHSGAGADSEDGRVEAWLRRPGHLTVRDASGVRISTGVPHSVTTMWFTSATDAEAAAAGSSAEWSALDQPVDPWFRPDGLVAVRPADYHLTHGDPMWQSYFWTAMLDPEEISHDVDITDVYAADRLGRPTWWATARTMPDYDPRCNCCALLNDQVSISLISEFFAEIDDRRERGWEVGSADVPTAHLVGLDVQTGIVVDITELDASCETWVNNEIHAVDEKLHPPLP